MPLHDPNSPRHGRIFELLRQTEQAQTTAERLHHVPRPAEEPSSRTEFRAFAVRSLQQGTRTAAGTEHPLRSAFRR